MSAAEDRRPEYLRPGAYIDGYRILSLLGHGSYGAVYRVERDGEQYALKLGLHREASADPEQTDRRMMKELGCLIHLSHPNILRVHAWGRWPYLRDGYCYLVVDYVDGWTLAEWLETQRPSFVQVLGLFAKLASALAYVHGRGFLHRDLSPGNILVRGADGEPFLADFNAGDYVLAEDVTDGPLPPGTHRYRDPRAVEFWSDNRMRPDARYDFQPADDQFSLAACLYDAVTDSTPTVPARQRDSPRQDLNSPMWGPPPAREVNERVPEALSALLDRLLAREPRLRPATADAMRRELEDLATQPGAVWAVPVFPPGTPSTSPGDGAVRPRGARPWKHWRVTAGAVLLAIVGVLVFVARREPVGQPDRSVAAPEARPVPEATVPGQDAGHLPSPAPPSGVALPSRPVAPTQKEAPAVKPAPAQPVPQKPDRSRPALSAEVLARCATVGVFTAALLGCPGAQVMPEREEVCPKSTRLAMEETLTASRWQGRGTVDIQQPDEDAKWGGTGRLGVFRDGEVVGRVEGPDYIGTLVYGRLKTVEKDGRLFLVGRYTRAKFPDGTEIPVCLHLGNYPLNPVAEGSKRGALLYNRVSVFEAVSIWP
ncbi:serine/threonine protein kinase [Pyxidicoccus xibeiensis]|uniref:serine/threonine protein kinase n=1 Tax=Pyxidicoccus xibeiensis TaxID=2906759 RepID=UPI0020A6F382|nr:serine/threonine protein kinase [Pyxidicoccus xibeiensis]MCP3139903.1 protein kinase [Pyxidicoccus xibeiensis]